MASIKQQLIDSLRAERRACHDRVGAIDYTLRELESRGSGPLQSHLIAEARRRGIEVPA